MLRRFAALALLLMPCLAVSASDDTVTQYVDAINARAPMPFGTLYEVTRATLATDTLVLDVRLIGNKGEELAEDYWSSVEVMALEETLCANDAQGSVYAAGYGLRFKYSDSDGKPVYERDLPMQDCRGAAAEAAAPVPTPEDNLSRFIGQVRAMEQQALDEKGEIVNDGAWVNAKEVGFQLRFARKNANQVKSSWFDSELAVALAVMHCKSGPNMEYAYSSGRTVVLHYVDKSEKTVRDVRLSQAKCGEFDRGPVKAAGPVKGK